MIFMFLWRCVVCCKNVADNLVEMWCCPRSGVVVVVVVLDICISFEKFEFDVDLMLFWLLWGYRSQHTAIICWTERKGKMISCQEEYMIWDSCRLSVISLEVCKTLMWITEVSGFPARYIHTYYFSFSRSIRPTLTSWCSIALSNYVVEAGVNNAKFI